MTKDEAITIVVDVATSRKPQSRMVLKRAVAVLEAKPVVKKKPAKVKE